MVKKNGRDGEVRGCIARGFRGATLFQDLIIGGGGYCKAVGETTKDPTLKMVGE